MGLGLGLYTIEGLLEIVHQVLGIFKPELIDTDSTEICPWDSARHASRGQR